MRVGAIIVALFCIGWLPLGIASFYLFAYGHNEAARCCMYANVTLFALLLGWFAWAFIVVARD